MLEAETQQNTVGMVLIASFLKLAIISYVDLQKCSIQSPLYALTAHAQWQWSSKIHMQMQFLDHTFMTSPMACTFSEALWTFFQTLNPVCNDA